MAIVLPDAILGAPGLQYVRHWMLQHCRLVGSVDLHPDTFQPRNGTQTSVLVLQKLLPDDTKTIQLLKQFGDYNVFMADVKAIGHDKRGNKIFKRNEDGEEILIEAAGRHVRMDSTASGEASIRPMPRQRVPDDDTPVVARDFINWKQQEVLGW
jgi:type I restriction enzyme M protein